MPNRGRHGGQRGFTLTELAIAIACVAVLTSVVVTMRGFIRDAQTKSTFTKVSNLHRAAQNWSKRIRGGQGYAGGGRFNRALSVDELVLEGLVDDDDPGAGVGIWTDWSYQLPPIGIGPTGAAVAGIGQTQFWMRICAPTTETADDFDRLSTGWQYVNRRRYSAGNCPCPQCVFEFILQ